MKFDKKHVLRFIHNFILINLGCIIYAASIALFLDPNNLAPGGVSGLCIIINYVLSEYFGISLGTGLWIVILNIPLFVLGFVKFKWKFLFSTFYATVISSVFVDVMNAKVPAEYIPITSDPMLAAITGGSLMALGMGLVWHGHATTGGFDIIVKVLRQKYKHIKSGAFFLIFDSMVIIVSAFAYKNIETALFATVALLMNSFLLDFVLYGNDSAKLIYIITDKPTEISERLLKELEVGVTYLNGEGAYTGEKKQVIMTAVHKQFYSKVRHIVKKEDKNAFMIVTKATEIFGMGFKNQNAEEL